MCQSLMSRPKKGGTRSNFFMRRNSKGTEDAVAHKQKRPSTCRQVRGPDSCVKTAKGGNQGTLGGYTYSKKSGTTHHTYRRAKGGEKVINTRWRGELWRTSTVDVKRLPRGIEEVRSAFTQSSVETGRENPLWYIRQRANTKISNGKSPSGGGLPKGSWSYGRSGGES